MNFKTRLSYDNRIMFVYENGDIRHTPFTEINFFGDNYILAKSELDTFYTVLDLNGNEYDKQLKIIHRFQNGLLLNYKAYKKNYTSSDNSNYFVNYNTYNILNLVTGKHYTAGIVQSDEITDTISLDVVQKKYRKTIICDFLNKPVHCFKEFIFSEILDNQYIITGNILMANPLNTNSSIEGYPDFDSYAAKKIWSVVDIFKQHKHDLETDISSTTIDRITFKEAELHLINHISLPDLPDKKDYQNHTVYKNVTNEYTLLRNWKKKNKWQLMIKNVLSFARN